jgi:hypothetical protein
MAEAMANEFIYAKRDEAIRFAKRKRWKEAGNAAWLKADGTCVHFIAFEEQLEAVQPGERVYVLARLSGVCSKRLKKIGAEIVRPRN